MLKGYGKLREDKIRAKIEEDHERRIKYMLKDIKEQDDKDKAEAIAREKIKKRKYMDVYRPHSGHWNLFEDGYEKEKVEHVLRANANPSTSYEDNRVQMILENITEIGANLRTYETEKWNALLHHVYQIFEFDYKNFRIKLEANWQKEFSNKLTRSI